jgi:hypothetical protein
VSIPPAKPNALAGVAATAAPKPPPPPAFQIFGLSEYDRFIKLLVHGDYGTGKTRLVASACMVPDMNDILFIDAEAGDLTVTTEPLFRPHQDRFKVIKVRDFKTFARVQEYLKLHCQYRDMNNEEGDAKLKGLELLLFPKDGYDPNSAPRKFRTVIIDSLSEVESYSMYAILGHTDKTRIDDETAGAEWAEYKKNHSQMLRAIRAYRDLPMNVLFTSAAAYTQDEQKRMIWSPALTGKLARQCQGFMDIVGFMTVAIGEGNMKKHNMQVQPTPKINAKCRFSNYKAIGFEDPTMKSILISVGLMVADPKPAPTAPTAPAGKP